MASLRQLKKRIRSVENTRKIARAMELVSNTKLRRISERVNAMRPYVDHMDSILKSIVSAAEELNHPLMAERKEKKNIALCVITSDSGLCGVYNANILRLADEFMRKIKDKKIIMIPIGKKGFSHYRARGMEIPRSFIGLNGRYNEPVIDEIAVYLQNIFLEQEADEVYVAYTRFETTVRHRPTLEKFLNIKPPVEEGHRAEFIWEPSQSRIFENMIPEYLILKMRSYLLQAFACEHTSRIIAMGMAKENAIELLEKLILLQNKIRQASITKEVLEIVTAAEALKG